MGLLGNLSELLPKPKGMERRRLASLLMTSNAKTDARQNDPGEKMSIDDKKGSKQKKLVQDSNVNVNGNQLM